MLSAYSGELSRRFMQGGLRAADATLLAVATVVGWSRYPNEADVRHLLSRLALELPARFNGDARESAREWLEGPGLAAAEREVIRAGYQFLQREKPSSIDWDAEFSASLMPLPIDGRLFLSLPLAQSLLEVLDLPTNGTFACLYNASASVAWELSLRRQVTLYADQETGILASLLATGAARSLQVSRRNPIDGTYVPAPHVNQGADAEPPFNLVDHIVAAPPFGGRVSEGVAKGASFEAYQLARLQDRAVKSFTALTADGLLFRDTKFEAKLRERLVHSCGVTVMSLPSGMYWPATAIPTSLIHLDRQHPPSVRVIDGRSMGKPSSGRIQEGLIVQHLQAFRGMEGLEGGRAAVLEVEEVAENGYSLVPDRYLKSRTLALIEKALEQRQVISLSDVATIERSKAPLPLREAVEDPPLSALELAPSDLEAGFVRTPSRPQAFASAEEGRVKGVTVRPHDILVSIKGNVGMFGIVGQDASLAEQMNEPWIVSQSLAIIRWKPNSYVSSPQVLNALLTAPWVREKLESLSGATTVRTLPISALRSLSIPAPTAEECAVAGAELERLATLRERIAKQQEELVEQQRQLWLQLWQVTVDVGEF
jgi:type I restriction-modification system DNA methylase subunit